MFINAVPDRTIESRGGDESLNVPTCEQCAEPHPESCFVCGEEIPYRTMGFETPGAAELIRSAEESAGQIRAAAEKYSREIRAQADDYMAKAQSSHAEGREADDAASDALLAEWRTLRDQESLEASQLLERAAKAGGAEAMYVYGRALELRGSPATALPWIRRSAAAGSRDAKLALKAMTHRSP